MGLGLDPGSSHQLGPYRLWAGSAWKAQTHRCTGTTPIEVAQLRWNRLDGTENVCSRTCRNRMRLPWGSLWACCWATRSAAHWARLRRKAGLRHPGPPVLPKARCTKTPVPASLAGDPAGDGCRDRRGTHSGRWQFVEITYWRAGVVAYRAATYGPDEGPIPERKAGTRRSGVTDWSRMNSKRFAILAGCWLADEPEPVLFVTLTLGPEWEGFRLPRERKATGGMAGAARIPRDCPDWDPATRHVLPAPVPGRRGLLSARCH